MVLAWTSSDWSVTSVASTQTLAHRKLPMVLGTRTPALCNFAVLWLAVSPLQIGAFGLAAHEPMRPNPDRSPPDFVHRAYVVRLPVTNRRGADQPQRSYSTLMAVARQRESSPSRRIATARVRARPRTITTASTTPSRGSQMLVEPIEKDGRVAF